jgi:hypothetical protein
MFERPDEDAHGQNWVWASLELEMLKAACLEQALLPLLITLDAQANY